MPCPAHHHDRRTFIGLLGVGLAATLAACSAGQQPSAAAPHGGPPSGKPPRNAFVDQPAEPLPPIPAAHPGSSTTVFHGLTGTDKICLTVDDGYCDDCVSGYVDFVRRSGIHLTFSPNGTYAHAWDPHANTIRSLLERKQVQIINHTFSHKEIGRASCRERV